MTIATEGQKVGRLLDRQMNLWDIRRRLAHEGGEPARRELAHVAEGPWITVSREIGSGWEAVTALVAEQLGWQVFDREILEEISRHANSREAILRHLDERDVNWIQDVVARLTGLVSPEDIGQLGFAGHLRLVILAIGKQGRAILVGRGANWLLDPAYGLRVQFVAPAEVRVTRLAAKEGLTLDQAARRVREDDAARAGFMRQVYHRDVHDPTGYDLIVNLASLPTEAAADAIVAALRRKLGAA